MRILAIDPGTACGWAHSSGASGVWDLSVRKDESGGMKLIRLRAKLHEINRMDGHLDLVVFEAARNAMQKMQGALVHQARLQGVIELWCMDARVEYRGYSPSELKKCATGKGGGKGTGKEDMVRAAREKLGYQGTDDNEADALWLLHLAKAEYAPDKV